MNLSKDGLELVFASNRPGSQGFDIWSASRDGVEGASDIFYATRD